MWFQALLHGRSFELWGFFKEFYWEYFSREISWGFYILIITNTILMIIYTRLTLLDCVIYSIIPGIKFPMVCCFCQYSATLLIIIIIIINTPRKNEMKNKKLKRLENDMKVKLKTVKKGLI
jgi:hypothetical protein